MVGGSNLSANTPPVGNVVATVGQFLMVGDIGFQYANGPSNSGFNAYLLGTGNGAQTVFSGTIPNVPLRQQAVIPFENGFTAGPDNGAGLFSYGQYTGTVNYATGAITITYATPPANGASILVAYTVAYPQRVQWSAIGLPEFFPAPLTNAALAFQSGYEDLPGDLGPVMGIFGYPLYALIFQRSGITRALYQGGNVVFAFGTYEWKQGLLARGAAVQVGANVYYLSDQGFFYTDGANVYPIGTAADNSTGIDKWFWSNVNYAALSSITGGYDASKRAVIFAICTGSNTSPDTLLIYNTVAQRWTRAQIPVSVVWSDTDGTKHRVGLFGQYISPGFAYESLTGTTVSGYVESADIYFIDGQRRLTTAARALVNSADQPMVTIGNRDDLKEGVKYGNGSFPDRFSKLNPCLSGGMYTRARVTSAAATSIHGVTLYMEEEGPM